MTKKKERRKRVGTLSTSGRGRAKATVPGMERDGSWGTSTGWRTDIRQGLGWRMLSPSRWCAEGEDVKLELGRRGWGAVTDRRQTGREPQKAEAERDRTPRGGSQPRPGRRDTYSGPSSGRRGSPPAAEGIGSRARPAGPGRSRTGRWSRPWLAGTPRRGARGP